ncbi:MAG TPA: helix-turn-helix transcriptional regulator [Eubacteriales bacterium]|jgi:DNA-binding PadR family transcriptional regulator|nr:helix-turn-helix transcriptional regulator [Eubacteriales bacterium]HRU84652.1 helix-turn-helix transcriptional regulator [Eubacteriales bacterium]
METPSVNSDIIRGNMITIILGSLDGGERYGYDILKEIEVKSEGKYIIKQPTLYNNLKRLEKQGLIESYLGEPDDTGGGRRRYYRLTELGRDFYERMKNEYVYARTIIDKLVTDEEFDFSSPAPFDIESLRPLTKRGSDDDKAESASEAPAEVREVEVIKEVPVEVIKEVEVIREVPVEIIKEVVREVPVEIVREVVKEVPVEVIREREVPVETIKEIEIIKQVETEKPIETLREIEVIKEVPYPVYQEVLVERTVEIEKPVEVFKSVEVVVDRPVEIVREIELTKEIETEKPIETLREIQVEKIKEVPVEIIREVEVIKEVEKERVVYIGVGVPERTEAAAAEKQAESEAYAPEYSFEGDEYQCYFQGLLALAEETREEEPQIKAEPAQKSEKSISGLKNRLFAAGYKMRPYIKAQSAEFYSKNYLYANKISSAAALVITIVMILETALFWIFSPASINQMVYVGVMCGSLLIYAIALAIRFINPLKRKRAEYDFRLSFLYRFMIFIELSVVAALLGVFVFKADRSDYSTMVLPIILPITLLSNIPLASVVYFLLFKSKRYNIS